MRTKIVILIFMLATTLLFSGKISAQDKPVGEKVYQEVEEMPEFPGGLNALRKFIANSIKYPDLARQNGIKGRVYVSFVVAKDGTVSDIKIEKGVDPILDKEALRVINELPKWKPGKQDGEAVNVAFTMPINFELGDDITVRSEPQTSNGEPVFMIVEEMPEFPGGEEALRKFISENIQYPHMAIANGIQGKVYVSFVVTKEGNVADTKIARGVDPILDKEALRVVNTLPAWKPGKQRGQEVNVAYTVPINFELGNLITVRPEPLTSTGEPLFMIVEEMPDFPGGEEALKKFLSENTQYPQIAKENGIQGKVYVTFVITKEGNVADTKIARGVDPILDKEALRVVNTLPAWKPGKQRGQAVNVSYTIPVNFEMK